MSVSPDRDRIAEDLARQLLTRAAVRDQDGSSLAELRAAAAHTADSPAESVRSPLSVDPDAQPPLTKAETQVSTGSRLDSVDLLRGIVMVIMTLDHARAFFGTSGWDPGFATASAATFLTRWITHFCAPVFVLLAGTGASLSFRRGKPKGELARFLLTRGAWLAALDMTVISFAWFFRIGAPLVSDVMWAIGWSMIVLSFLIFLPVRVTAIFGLVLVAAHNALDGLHASAFGSAAWVWTLLHEQGLIRLPWGDWFAGYPLIPWVGVMALGYALGFILGGDASRRRRRLVAIGVGMIVVFIVLRAANVYGDPQPWSKSPSLVLTVFSFISCHKYPPSLLYLLMTLGPAMLALAALDRARPGARNPLLVFGRVPLFYYVVHLYLIHLAAGIAFLPRLGLAAFHVDPDARPAAFGVPLGIVYLIWGCTVLAMLPLCRWFAGVKQRRRSIWLSYL